MITDTLYILDYDWVLHIIADCSCSSNDYIIKQLRHLGCSDKLIREAMDNLETCNFNIGLTYSNKLFRESLMVVCKTNSLKQLINTFTHECYHLVEHIGVSKEEQGATLIGNVMGMLWSIIKEILITY